MPIEHEPDSETATSTLFAVIDELIATAGEERRLDDVRAAREQYRNRRGRVFEDEELWEAWVQSFLEWYVCERPAADTGRAPVVDAIRGQVDAERRACLRAWMMSQRTLVEVQSKAAGMLLVRDLVGGALFPVTEERALHGFEEGDIAEVRLLGHAGHVRLGRTFLFHPAGTRAALLEQIRQLRDAGKSWADVVDHCAVLRIRCERYRHVSPQRIYEAATGEFVLGGDRASG